MSQAKAYVKNPTYRLIYYINVLADCIGSAFNTKGAMQCPNCRKIEKGQWLFGSGSRPPAPEISMEDWALDEDVYYSVSEVVSIFPLQDVDFLSVILKALHSIGFISDACLLNNRIEMRHC